MLPRSGYNQRSLDRVARLFACAAVSVIAYDAPHPPVIPQHRYEQSGEHLLDPNILDPYKEGTHARVIGETLPPAQAMHRTRTDCFNLHSDRGNPVIQKAAYSGTVSYYLHASIPSTTACELLGLEYRGGPRNDTRTQVERIWYPDATGTITDLRITNEHEKIIHQLQCCRSAHFLKKNDCALTAR